MIDTCISGLGEGMKDLAVEYLGPENARESHMVRSTNPGGWRAHSEIPHASKTRSQIAAQ
jgi:hypothetical protein